MLWRRTPGRLDGGQHKIFETTSLGTQIRTNRDDALYSKLYKMGKETSVLLASMMMR